MYDEDIPLLIDHFLRVFRKNYNKLQLEINPETVRLLSNHDYPGNETDANITRRQIKHLRFRANTVVKAESKIILCSVYLYYRTKHLNETIIRNGRVNNDIINTVQVQINFPTIEIVTKTDAALMYTPLSAQELRDPRKEDREAAAALVSFLNENLEMAHKMIWATMDSSRLFGLLDGYIAPNSGGRSVASVVENKVMGKCNSCEEIDETRHWQDAEDYSRC